MANEIHLDSLIQACRKRGLEWTPRRYRQLANEDRLPKPVNGKVDALEALIAMCVYFQKIAQGSGSLSLTDERVRRVKIQADRDLLKYKQERGELIKTELAIWAWGGVIQNIYAKFRSVPSKATPLVYGQTHSIIEATITKLIDEVLEECASPDLKEIARMAGDPPGVEHAEAPAETDSEPVGRQKQDT